MPVSLSHRVKRQAAACVRIVRHLVSESLLGSASAALEAAEPISADVAVTPEADRCACCRIQGLFQVPSAEACLTDLQDQKLSDGWGTVCVQHWLSAVEVCHASFPPHRKTSRAGLV